MRVEAAKVGCMIEGGAISQPIRQPVAANASSQRKSVEIVQYGDGFLTPRRTNSYRAIPHSRQVGNTDVFFSVKD